MVLALLRSGEGIPVLRSAATELAAQGQAALMELPPLSPGGVATLIASVRGGRVDEDDAAKIYAETGGNPWFVEAVAQGRGALTVARDRMLLRLDRLERTVPGACALLATLAPTTRSLPHPVVSAMWGSDSDELRRILSGLREGGVLDENEHGWGFRHDLLRRSVLEGMIGADRRDAHRLFAEVLERTEPHAAELAMHFALADDRRAARWALQAAQEYEATDAHIASLSQIQRALEYATEPEARREAMLMAATGTWLIGRFAEARRRAEEALSLPGGSPEARSTLHRRAAEAARLSGDPAAARTHLDQAEALLAGRPPSEQMARVAVARVIEAVIEIEPEQVIPRIERALAIARELSDDATGKRLERETSFYGALWTVVSGSPSGADRVEELVRAAEADAQVDWRLLAEMLLNAYAVAVAGLGHGLAESIRRRLDGVLQRHQLPWEHRINPYRALDLVQRGRFDEAVPLLADAWIPPAGTAERAAWLCAKVVHQARAGTLERARALLGTAGEEEDDQQWAMLAAASLDVMIASRDVMQAGAAAQTYARADRHQHARLAGIAAVVVALCGGDPSPSPAWLAQDSPTWVFWRWAAGIRAGDQGVLREVAQTLEGMACPYEAALARVEAADLAEAYRKLTELGATTVRAQVAARMRESAQRVPREQGTAKSRRALA
jgi:hypothetical protein